MPSRIRRYLLDMIYNIHLAQRFLKDIGYEDFRNDELVFYAVTRCLEIISEASRRLPAEVKVRHPEIPWAEMASAGNIFRHDYEDVQQRLVWGTVHNRLPEMLAILEEELQSSPENCA